MYKKGWVGENRHRNIDYAGLIMNFYNEHSHNEQFDTTLIADADYFDKLPEFNIIVGKLSYFYRKVLKLLKPFYPQEFAEYKAQEKAKQVVHVSENNNEKEKDA